MENRRAPSRGSDGGGNGNGNEKRAGMPSYSAFVVREYERAGETKTAWTDIGVAFTTKKGDGLNLHLDALPTNGSLVLLPYEERKKRGDRGDGAERNERNER